MKLAIELIPKAAHFQNARGVLTKSQWERVKTATTEAAGGVCEICQSVDRLESHEIWAWTIESEGAGLQRLVRTIALCPWCHRCKHWGHTEGTGLLPQARRHILKVNCWSEAQLEDHIRQAWREWMQLSKITWQLDISALNPMIVGVKTRRRTAPDSGLAAS